ncbi:MAG: hypothetical protein ACPL2D_10550 [Ignavibacteria bacterium]
MDTLSSDKLIISENKVLLAKPPDGYEYKLVPKEKTEQEKLQEQLAQLEDELSKMEEPDDKELIEWGKASHPYYNLYYKIEMLRGLLNENL